MKVVERERAQTLRKQGKSINEIVRNLGVSKASVSVWVRDITLTKKQKEKISEKGRSIESVEKRRTSRLFNEELKRENIINQAKKDITNISLRDLKLIGIILYLGEGGKTKMGTVRVSNADPLVIVIMMRFFREICLVPEDKFRGNVHTFSHANIKETEIYWSNLTNIPTRQFHKTYTKPSSASLQKRQTLPFGTFSIYISDTKLFLTILGWIEKIKELTTVKA